MQPGPQPLHRALQGRILAKQPPIVACQRRGIPLTRRQREVEGESGTVPRLALEHQRAPIFWASWWQMARPSPVPPKRRVMSDSTCSNGVNRRSCLSSAMPMPVSLTAMASRSFQS